MGGTLLAYVDGTGDTGVGSSRSSLSFTVGCVVIKEELVLEQAEVVAGEEAA